MRYFSQYPPLNNFAISEKIAENESRYYFWEEAIILEEKIGLISSFDRGIIRFISFILDIELVNTGKIKESDLIMYSFKYKNSEHFNIDLIQENSTIISKKYKNQDLSYISIYKYIIESNIFVEQIQNKYLDLVEYAHTYYDGRSIVRRQIFYAEPWVHIEE